MIWFWLTLSSIFCFSSASIIEKFIIEKHLPNYMIVTILSEIFYIISIMFLLFFVKIIIPPTNILLITLGAGILYFLAFIFYFKAVKLEEISRISSLILSFNPLFVVLIAFIFLGEILTLNNYIGITLIIIASILISLRKKIKFELSPAFLLILFCALGIAAKGIMIKYVLDYINVWNAIFWEGVGAFLMASPFILFYHKPLLKTILTNKKPVIYMSIPSIASVIGDILLVFALSYQFVSLVASVGATQPIITFSLMVLISIFAPRILKEEIKRSTLITKAIAIVISIVGVLLVI